MANEIPVIMHPGGVHAEDQDHYGTVPTEAVAPRIIKEPPVGSFTRFCALVGMTNAAGALQFGHLKLHKKGTAETRANYVRVPLLDNPDGV
jgi:hypothetical protein